MKSPLAHMVHHKQRSGMGWVAVGILSIVVAWSVLLAGCTKEESGAPAIAALLPPGARVPVELQLIAEQLPEDVQGFGYVDGLSMRELSPLASGGRFEPMIKDFSEMTKRRWGFELTKVRGVGLIHYQGDDLLALVVPSEKRPTNAWSNEAGDAAAAVSLGPIVVMGERRIVEAFSAAAKQKPRLYKSSPGWVSSALPRAAHQRVFFTGNVTLFRSSLPEVFSSQLANLERATFTAGDTGLSAFFAGKSGRGPQIEADVKTALGLLRARMTATEQELKAEPGRRLFAVLLHHYGEAAFNSLQQQRTGDEVALTLGWHAPAWPKRSPAPLAERLSVADEMAISQLNLGMPIVQLFLQLTDVLAAPLDRAALTAELSAALVELGLPRGLDPSAFTISAGASGYLASVKNAPLGDGGAPLAMPLPELAAIQTKWGVGIAEDKDRDAMMLAYVSDGPSASLLAKEKLLADDTAFLRIFFDITKVPPAARTVAVVAPLRSVAIALTETSFVLEAHTDPGKAQELVDAMRGAMSAVSSLPFLRDDRAYSDRAKAPAGVEALMIMKHHQIEMLTKVLTPEVVSGDRMRLAWNLSPTQARAFFVATATAMVSAALGPPFKRKLRDAEAANAATSDAAAAPESQ